MKKKNVKNTPIYTSKEYKVKRRNELMQKLTVDEVLDIPAIQKYCNALISGVVNRKIKLIFNRHSDSIYTDNERIVINPEYPLIKFYLNIYSQIMCIIGLLAHELSHICYLDFPYYVKVYKNLENQWFWAGGEPTDTTTAAEIKELCDKIPAMHKLVLQMFHSFNNIFADVHDENCMIKDRPQSILAKAIPYPASAMMHKREHLDTILRRPQPVHPIGVCTGLVLDYARFHSYMVRESTMNDTDIKPYVEFLNTCKTTIDRACITNDMEERFHMVNEIIVTIFRFFKNDMIQKAQNQNHPAQQQQTSNNNSNNNSNSGNSGQGQSGMSSTSANASNNQSGNNTETSQNSSDSNSSNDSNNSNSSNGSNSTSSSSNATSSDSHTMGNGNGQMQAGNDNSQQTGNQHNTTSNSGTNETTLEDIFSDKNTLNSLIEKIHDMLKGLSTHESNMKDTPNESMYPKQNTQLTNEDISASSESNDASDTKAWDELHNILGQPIQQVLDAQIEREAEQKRTQQLNQEMHSIDYGQIHAKVCSTINRKIDIDTYTKECYNLIYNEVKAYSKAMQRQVLTVLKDRRAGGKAYGQVYGKRFENKSLARLDGCYFSKTKMPTETPTIAVGVLIDESGSMYGTRMQNAVKTAILLEDFARGLDIPIMIYGHYELNEVTLNSYCEFDTIDKNDKYRLAGAANNGRNRDGYALKYMVEALKKRQEDIKMLFIISDGKPNGAGGYSGTPAINDIKNIVKDARKNNMIVFAAAIGEDKETIANIYGDGFWDISNMERMPKMFVNIIKKQLNL